LSQGWEIEEDDPWIVFPKGAYKTAEEFMDSVQQVEIPFMTQMGYRIQAVPDFQEDGVTRNWCF